MLLGFVLYFVDGAVILDFCYVVLLVFVFAIINIKRHALCCACVCYIVTLSGCLSFFFSRVCSSTLCLSLDHVPVALS